MIYKLWDLLAGKDGFPPSLATVSFANDVSHSVALSPNGMRAAVVKLAP